MAGTGRLPSLDAGAARRQGLHTRNLSGDPGRPAWSSLGADPAAYTAAAIRGFVLDRAKPHGRGRAQGITVATRAYLKYLVATGQCPVGREQAVPSFANWQLATTPRFLGQVDIDRLFAACDGEDRLRDRAVILLLARLGLRASEVANLAFDEIDWVAGRITLAGKARREERLPLTQETWRCYPRLYRAGTATRCDSAGLPDECCARQAAQPHRREMHRAPCPRQGRRQEHPSWGSCSAPLRRDDHAAQRRQPCRRRRRAAAPFPIGHSALCQG